MSSRSLAAICGLSLSAVALTAGAPSHAAPEPPDAYEKAAAAYLVQEEGLDPSEARRTIDRQQTQSKRLARLEQSIASDGTYFDGDQLVVVVASQAEAKRVRDAGLSARVGGGESTLSSRADTLRKSLGSASKYVHSIAPDIVTETIEITVATDTPPTVIADLSDRPDVTVSRGDAVETFADVVPGQIMDFTPNAPSGNCSLGFPGTLTGGHTVLLTAGHCVISSLSNVYDAEGTKLGYTFHTRYAEGKSSVDMGIMDIDAEDVGQPYVDTRAGNTLPIRGMQRAPIGAAICKAGNTTGWTCGTVKSYNNDVYYTNSQTGVRTLVNDLAYSTVCSEPGDSGGAYIWGDQAQGMTSGGPAQECGYNGGNIKGVSYYQPVQAAAQYYGVTLTTQ